jgi:hypothetical protein
LKFENTPTVITKSFTFITVSSRYLFEYPAAPVASPSQLNVNGTTIAVMQMGRSLADPMTSLDGFIAIRNSWFRILLIRKHLIGGRKRE